MVSGYPHLRALPSWQFAHWRAAALRIGIRRSYDRLVQPAEWSRLDPSEKGALSSLLGVAVTKLLTEQLLGAPLLLFLDVYFNVVFAPGKPKIRPDFVAISNSGEYFSVEAKGRARFSKATLRKGKDQAKSLGLVNGQPVTRAVVCVTSFKGGQLQVRFADPELEGTQPLHVRFNSAEAVRWYYAGLLRYRQYAEPSDKTSLQANELPVRLWRSRELDLEFGIHPEVERLLESGVDERRLLGVLANITPQRTGSEPWEMGPDGIVVWPGESWVDRMSSE